MMTRLSILFLLIFTSISCKPEYIKINNNLYGTWQIDSFDYVNEDGRNISSNASNYTIKFEDNKVGTILADSLRYNVIYDFGYQQWESGFADCDIKVENNRTLPINIIGRVQVYSYKFLDKNTLLFHSENEFDYTTNSVIKNATYKFVRR